MQSYKNLKYKKMIILTILSYIQKLIMNSFQNKENIVSYKEQFVKENSSENRWNTSMSDVYIKTETICYHTQCPNHFFIIVLHT